MRALRSIPLVLASVLGLVAIPAMAAADDALQEYLESASTAEFHGTGVVMCSWDGSSAAAAYEVVRADGMSMVHGPSGDLMITGAVVAARPGEAWSAVTMGSAAEWRLSDRYSMSAATPTTGLGRAAHEVRVIEDDGSMRALIVVDDETGVPLRTEVFDGSGGVFRESAMIRFAAVPGDDEYRELAEMADTAAGLGVRSVPVMIAPPSTLPADAAGYRLTDTYSVGDRSVQAFYSDGLFSFSLFEWKRTATPVAFLGAPTFTWAGHVYRRLVTPSHVWVQWHSPDRTYVLVGDLPPDHLHEVLDALPAPGDRALLVRLWRRLFG